MTVFYEASETLDAHYNKKIFFYHAAVHTLKIYNYIVCWDGWDIKEV